MKTHQKNNFLVGVPNLCSEFIGRRVEIVESSNKTILGLVGEIVDETKETLSIRVGGGANLIRKIFKRSVCLRFADGSVISGSMVAVRSSERLKLDPKKCANRLKYTK